MRLGRLQISYGRRCWEVQAHGLYVNSAYSGAPFMTRKDALEAAKIWATKDFYDSVVARNVETGEKLRP